MKEKILMLIGEGFEDAEVFYPYYRLIEEGFDVEIAALEKGTVLGKHGISIEAKLNLEEVKPADYVSLVIPGGKGPERLRLNPRSAVIVKKFISDGKVVAAICHGPQLLISASAVKGKKITSYAGIKDDVIAAGGKYFDREVVVDGKIVTSRTPADLPYFMKETVKLLKKDL